MKKALSKVLVTGGCGYLGAQLVRDLSETFPGLKIRILDNLQGRRQDSLLNLPRHAHFEFIEGDILHPPVLRYGLEGVDAVVHLAALARTPMSFEDPGRLEQVNHWGTANVVEACLASGVRRLIYLSSGAVFGPGGPFAESDRCRPFGPYAQSKLMGEKSVLGAGPRGMLFTILRCATLYGRAPVIRFEAVLNRFIFLAGTARPLVIQGSGEQKRPFIHVKDASRAIEFCLSRPKETANEIFNVVDRNVSILELAHVVRSLRPQTRMLYTEQDMLTHLSFEVQGDRLRQLGWSPAVELEDGVKDLLEEFHGLSAPPPTLSRDSDP